MNFIVTDSEICSTRCEKSLLRKKSSVSKRFILQKICMMLGCFRCSVGVRRPYFIPIPQQNFQFWEENLDATIVQNGTLDLTLKYIQIHQGLLRTYPFPKNEQSAALWKKAPALWYQLNFLHEIADLAQEFLNPCANLQSDCVDRICRDYNNEVMDRICGHDKIKETKNILAHWATTQEVRNMYRFAARDGTRRKEAIIARNVYETFSSETFNVCTLCDQCQRCPLCQQANVGVAVPQMVMPNGKSVFSESNRSFTNTSNFLERCESQEAVQIFHKYFNAMRS